MSERAFSEHIKNGVWVLVFAIMLAERIPPYAWKRHVNIAFSFSFCLVWYDIFIVEGPFRRGHTLNLLTSEVSSNIKVSLTQLHDSGHRDSGW